MSYLFTVACCVLTLSVGYQSVAADATADSLNEVVVLVDYVAFNCSSSSNSGSGTATGSSSSEDPFIEPIVYLKHGPHDATPWSYLALSVVWWNTSLVSGIIPSSHEFVVLCVGSFIHCGGNEGGGVYPESAGTCVQDGGTVNFKASENVTAVLVVPTMISSLISQGVSFGVLSPFCSVGPSVWAPGYVGSPTDLFIASGTSARNRSVNNALLQSAEPCGGNGECLVHLTVENQRQWFNPQCKCRGAWGGSRCSECRCTDPAAFCVAVDGGCVTAPSTHHASFTEVPPLSAANESVLMSQGIAILLVSSEWYGKLLAANLSQVRFNAGNITPVDTEWSNWNFTTVRPMDRRWGSFNATPYADAKHPDGTDMWMMAVVPGNLLQFVIYSGQMTDFMHCNVLQQLIPGMQSSSAYQQQFWGQYECASDQLNDLYNFASVGGIVEVSQTSFKVIERFEPGCQYGLVASTNQSDGSSTSSVLPCSGHGSCDLNTFFRCDCVGNFTGVGCENCSCTGGATCAADGGCECPDGFQLCHSTSADVCLDVRSDPLNCGACGNDCSRGMTSAEIPPALCIDGICHVKMKSALEWKLCFGSMPSGGSTTKEVPVSCFMGYDFLVVFCCSFPLFLVSLAAFLRMRVTCQETHKHRQGLFFLIALIAGMRMSYAVAALVFLATAKTPEDAVRSRDFFAATMISLNAFADLFTGFIDLLLTVYWLFVLDRVRVFPRRLLIMGCAGMTMTLLVATIVDYASSTSSFNYTFFTVAILLFFTALMHMTVIVEVLVKFVAWWRTNALAEESGGSSSEPESAPKAPTDYHMFTSAPLVASTTAGTRSPLQGRLRQPNDHSNALSETLEDTQALLAHPARHEPTQRMLPSAISAHFLRVTLIAVVCLLCWMVRSVMLLGRATKQEVFVSGNLSFATPTFTLLYLTLLTLFPCMLIAIIFIALSIDVLRAATRGKQQDIHQPLKAPTAASSPRTIGSGSGGVTAAHDEGGGYGTVQSRDAPAS